MNWTPLSFSKPTIFLEKPQRGVSGDPFMNRTTWLWFINFRSRCSSSSGVSSAVGAEMFAGACAGAWFVRESGLYVGVEACFAICCVRAGASAPATRAKSVCPYQRVAKIRASSQSEYCNGHTRKRMNDGTASISKDSAISAWDSASTYIQ